MEKRIEAAYIAKMESLKQTTDSTIMTLEKDIIQSRGNEKNLIDKSHDLEQLINNKNTETEKKMEKSKAKSTELQNLIVV